MKVIVTAIFFLLLGMNLKGQSLKGLIFQRGSSIPVIGVTVSIPERHAITQSDRSGSFSIDASVGDTLIIWRSGFLEQRMAVTSLDKQLIIYLAKAVELSEVRVTGQSKKQELDEIKRQYRRKGSYHAGKPPLLAYIFTPLTALYELVGKTPGQARRFNKYYSREVQEAEIDRRFNFYKLKELTGYEGADLRNFAEIYRPPFELVATWADYDLVNYVKKSSDAFEAGGRPAPPALPRLPKAPDLSEKIIIKD